MSTANTAVEVPEPVLDYLQQRQTLTLATASPGGVPRASTFLYVNEGPNLYFWTRATTITARQVEQNPIVAFTIDHYTDDLSQTRGIQGIGECSVLLSGEDIARVADLFGQKFPSLSPGSTMSISFFRITPTELDFIDNTASGSGTSGSSGTFGAEFRRDRSYSVLTNLPIQYVETITTTLQGQTAAAGDTIVRQGTPADKLLIVVEGQAEVVRDDNGQERQIATLGAGDLFGEVAIMRDQPRSASVRATTDIKLLTLERDRFRDLIAQSMEITPDFDKVIRSRLDAQATG
ncbi:MAG: cyclic nucleotide-binding domain-containing protein [Solirubrobacterales bacterium]|nr:cyclic nucleotide-binding domain-containing protein [Solirubrobacterales bacterium]MBV9715636.1 cyclic nucleotide-binding domain-containing protein [Solirubrobacterales bacterium]